MHPNHQPRDQRGRFSESRHDEAGGVPPLGPHLRHGAAAGDGDDEHAHDSGHDYEALAAAATVKDSGVLTRLSEHPSHDVRCEVALNPFAPNEVIGRLAQDRDPTVRWTVAAIPRPGIGELMSKDPDPIVRLRSLDAVDLPDDTRQKLLGDPAVRQICEALKRPLD